MAVGVLAKVRARRRYRQMSRRLAELDLLDAHAPADADAGVSDEPTTRRRRLSRGEIVFVLGVVAVIGVLALLRIPDPGTDGSVTPAAPSYPPVPGDAAAVRILPAVAASTTGEFLFLRTLPDGTPVSYDPCRPVHYVINTDGMPERGLAMVREAVKEISTATGLALQEDGFTDEPLAAERDPRQPRYGDKWAPVLIGWSDETRVPALAGDVTGVGGSLAFTPTGPESQRLVTGDVALDRDWFADAAGQPGGYAAARGVVIHELGHVVGLGHVTDGGEIMNATKTVTKLGPGDRQGLAAVGNGPCHRDT